MNGGGTTRPWVRLSALASLLLVATGCQTYKDQAGAMRNAWAQGQVEAAANSFSKRAWKRDDSRDGVIWHLEAGAAQRAAGNFTNSNLHFDEAVAQIEEYEQKAKVRLGNEAAATMSNLQNLPYEGRGYDKIMLHTYRALNYLALGEIEKARPEIIRAYQRQQDAVADNARRIENAQEEAKEDANAAAVERTRNNPALAAQIGSFTNAPEGFVFYADYVNPFTVFLDGLYFRHAGSGGSDRERAEKSFRRVVEVAGENPVVTEEITRIRETTDEPVTYVIFESGRGASLDQVRIDIPIIVTDVSYIGVAFPKLEYHGDAPAGLTIEAGGVTHQTAPLSNMDSVIALDFNNEWPVILTKTIISATAKAVAAYAANRAASQQDELAGALMRIGTAIAQAAVNIADTRSWTTLPKEFQIARLPTPADRKVVVSTPAGMRQEVGLVEGVVTVVYVRGIASTTPLLINQFKLR